MRPLHGPDGRIRQINRNRRTAQGAHQGLLSIFGIGWILIGINQPEPTGAGILIGFGLLMLWLAWPGGKR